jgi:hypothetical protein
MHIVKSGEQLRFIICDHAEIVYYYCDDDCGMWTQMRSFAHWFHRLVDAEKVLHHLPNREHLRIHSQFGVVK